jgi:hypothetical protein
MLASETQTGYNGADYEVTKCNEINQKSAGE